MIWYFVIVFGDGTVTADQLIIALFMPIVPDTFCGAFKENGVTWTDDDAGEAIKLLNALTENSYVTFPVKPEILLCVIFPDTSRVLMFDGLVIS